MTDENNVREKLVTISDLSRICGIEINTVRKWIKEGDMKIEYQQVRSKQIKSLRLGTFIDYVDRTYDSEYDPDNTNRSIKVKSRSLRLAQDNLSKYVRDPTFRHSAFPPVGPGYVSVEQAVDELHEAIGGDPFEATEVVVEIVTSLPPGTTPGLPRDLLDDLINQYKK